MSFAEPIHQQQMNNPYSNNGGFNTFNLQAQMTGMPPQMTAQQNNNTATNPFGANMFSIQSQPTGMFATPTQQQQQQPIQTQVTKRKEIHGSCIVITVYRHLHLQLPTMQ